MVKGYQTAKQTPTVGDPAGPSQSTGSSGRNPQKQPGGQRSGAVSKEKLKTSSSEKKATGKRKPKQSQQQLEEEEDQILDDEATEKPRKSRRIKSPIPTPPDDENVPRQKKVHRVGSLTPEPTEDQPTLRSQKKTRSIPSSALDPTDDKAIQRLRKKARHVAADHADEETGGSAPRSHSPPRFTALQKEKAREVQKPSTSGYRKRPGPNAQAHAAGRQLQTTPPVSNRRKATRQREGGSSTSRPTRGAVECFWTQIAKVYGMMLSPWVSEPVLSQALHCKLGDEDSGGEVHELVDFLDGFGISDDDRRHPQFFANFLLGLRELRGEIVSSLKGVAMQFLGFGDTPESQFRDDSFVKSQHPGFVDLLEDNKFLGVGDEYLCSDQIVKALRVILCGPSSIKTLKNPSRSRRNRYGFQKIPPVLLAFTTTVIYFILHGTGNFESDPEGEAEYQVFFTNRLAEIQALGHKSRERIFGTLEEEVFGIKKKQATAEQMRQRRFSEARLQEIITQAAIEAEEQDEEVGGDEGDEGGKENQGSGGGEGDEGDEIAGEK